MILEVPSSLVFCDSVKVSHKKNPNETKNAPLIASTLSVYEVSKAWSLQVQAVQVATHHFYHDYL